MNRSPHLQAVLAQRLHGPAWSANGSLAQKLITEQPANSAALLHLESEEEKKWKYVADYCVLQQGFSTVTVVLLTSTLCHVFGVGVTLNHLPRCAAHPFWLTAGSAL